MAEATQKKKKFNPKMVLRIVWSMLRRRWLPLGVGLVIALIAGAFGSKPLTEKVWKAQTLLLYTPPTISDDIGSMKNSLELQNMSGFATSRPVLHDVRDELGLEFPIALLAKAIKVETSRNSMTVFFTLNWGDKDEAVRILEQLTISYPEHVSKVRQNMAQGLLEESEEQIAATDSRLQAARTRHRDFTRTHNIVNFKQDLVLMQSKILDLETRQAKIQRDEEGLKDTIKLLDTHINNVRKEEEAEAEANKEFEAASESLADNRRRQNRLRELIQDERRAAEIRAQIEVKRREYERAKRLFDKQLISASQLETTRSQLETLIAKISESESILKWKTELEELDKLVVPKNKVAKKGSPIIQQILAKKLQAQLDISRGQKNLLQMDRELTAAKAQIELYQKQKGELKRLEDEVESLHQEKMLVEKKASLYRELANMGPTEFAIVSPVSAGNFPISSTRKKMFIGVVIAVMFLCFSTIAAYDVLRMGIIPPDAQVEMMGLQRLARITYESYDEDDFDEDDEENAHDAAGGEEQVRQDVENSGEPISSSQAESGEESDSEESAKQKESADVSINDDDDDEEYAVLPSLSVTGKDASCPEAVRQLGLLLRRAIPNPGSVLLVSNFEDPDTLDELIVNLAKCFSRRDERVLILDARPAGDGLGRFADLIQSDTIVEQVTTVGPAADSDSDRYLPGIRNWLAFECDELKEITYPTDLPGVDCILPGLSDSDDLFCTIRMSEAMEDLRKRYTMTLLLAHNATYLTEVQVLAAYADSITFAYDPNIRIESSAAKTVKTLEDLEAPILGSLEL